MTNKLFLIFSIQFYASIFLVFIPFVILYKTSRLQTLVKFFVLLNRPDDKVIDKTSSYRKSQNENGNTSKFFVGFHRIKKFSSPKIKIWLEPMFFSGFFCGFHRCGSAAQMTISSFSNELILTHFSKFFNPFLIEKFTGLAANSLFFQIHKKETRQSPEDVAGAGW